MAEINFNNLYNQLKPMEKRFYDQQFQKSYNPNQENIMLSSQPAYEQMKAVYDAQQQVPEENFLDKINIFGSASAAEMPQVPNLTYRNIDLPFDLNTGVTNTTQAAPFLKSMADIDASGNVNTDLVNQLIAENQMKASQFDPTNFKSIFPTSGIKQQVPLQNLGIDTSYGVANEPDVEQVKSLGSDEPSGIAKLLKFLLPGDSAYNFLGSILPKQSPESIAMKNFYGSQYGLTPTGQVASGIMQGYNPVSGGFLNMITGGKYGKPTQYGLAGAMQRRIENILGRKLPQTAASAAKIAELKKLQLDEMKMREKGGESLSDIGKSTFSGPGMAFAPKKDTFSGGKTKTTGGVPGGKYGSPK